jgi:hypothetical protein
MKARVVGAWMALAWATTLVGCGNLLPRSSTVAPSAFDSFEAARTALERVVPYQTTTAQLRELGFDIQASANVSLIPYPQVITRLAPNPNVTLEMLDQGIRDCIAARQACKAYEFSISHQSRRREGAFFLDFLNFRRTTEVTGWHFEGMFVVRDDLVLFRNYGGEPQSSRTERRSNPLGPFQPAGESAGSLLVK